MSEPSAVIAEDEPVLRSQLAELLAALWPELKICAQVSDGLEAAEALRRCSPTVLFLDIELPGQSGLKVAELASGNCHVVFVTAYDHYAVAAFEQGVVDYVMKPLSRDRVAVAVARLKKRLGDTPANLQGILREIGAALAPRKEYLRWITTAHGRTVRLITVDEVCYFRSDRKYTLVMTPQGESVIRVSISELIEQVDPGVFWQVHRSTLVNVNAIAEVRREVGGRLRLSLKQRPEILSVSEPYYHLFKSM
jgi:DNA-binding LytR/AlgR family response regulator